MTATTTNASPKAARRPVPEMLLELAYRLHATKVVARVPGAAPKSARRHHCPKADHFVTAEAHSAG